MWDLPGPGLEAVSLALAARFLTTVSPGKPLFFSLHVLFHRITEEGFQINLYFFFCTVLEINILKFLFHLWRDRLQIIFFRTSFTQPIFIKYLLCARYWLICLGYWCECNEQSPCLPGLYKPEQEADTELKITYMIMFINHNKSENDNIKCAIL